MKRWKMFFPLLRCPGCRRWIRIVGHAEFKPSLATKAQIAAVVPTASPPESTIYARTREEGGE